MSYYLKKHWGRNAIVVVFQTLWAAARVLQNVLIMGVFQAVIEWDLRQLLLWLVLYLGACVVECVFNALRSWAKARAIRAMNNHVRADITATLLAKSHQVYHAQTSGEYLSQYTNDIHQIERFAWTSFYGLISLIAQIVFSAAVLAYLHWSLLALSVLTASLMIAVPGLVGKRVEHLSAVCTEAQAQATTKFKDLLAGLDVLRAFGRTERFISGSADASEQMEQPKYRLTYVQTITEDVIAIMGAAMQIAVLALCGVLSIQGMVIQSTFSGAGNVCGTVCNGLAQVGQMILSMRAAQPYFDKITLRADAVQPKLASTEPLQTAITVEDLDFSYGEKPVLQKARFRFERGGKYALTGPSGCGKSTLLKLLLGWLPTDGGSICFDGRDDLTVEQRQQQMSYIEQNVFLFDTTIRENITLGGAFSEAALEAALRGSALAADLLEMPLGLDTPVGEEGSALSGGQKQRVAIARALLHGRSILLVDEGTSALDQRNAEIVEQTLLSDPNLTLILVSHHLKDPGQFTQVYELAPLHKKESYPTLV